VVEQEVITKENIIDPFLASLVDQDTPKLNPILANGLACAHIPMSEAHIDSVWHAVARGFPPEFKYMGSERCTPQEEFNELTKKKNNKRYYDVAISDIYMQRYTFTHEGEKIERYLKLPFVGPAGTLHVSGSRFIISPVHADTAISILPTNIFVRLIRAKVTFEREQQHYMAEGVRETAHVAWSEIYNKNKKTAEMKPAIDAHTTIVHYLFCKYGMTKAFQMVAGCTPVVGTQETITEETHPSSDWVVCTSTKLRPVKTYKLKFHIPSNIAVAIPRAQYEDPKQGQVIKNMVCGFFYIVDHFPTRVKPEWVDRESNWMILLGHLIWGSNVGDGRILSDVKEHIGSLDEYIDEIMRLKFIEIGMPIDNIYQLFGIILEKFNDWLLGAADNVSSMYGKELNILYYVLGDITKQINKFYFKLKSAHNSKRDPQNGKRALTKKEIENLMNATISPGLIYAITRTHGEVSTISSSGDNMAFKITSMLVQQANSTRQKGGKSDNATISDPTKRVHVSVAEIGGYTNLPKSEPSGHSRLNLCTKIDSKGVVLQDPELKPLLDEVQEMVKRY
jgi:hypothetical protein